MILLHYIEQYFYKKFILLCLCDRFSYAQKKQWNVFKHLPWFFRFKDFQACFTRILVKSYLLEFIKINSTFRYNCQYFKNFLCLNT